jgi:hypothetical protein
LEVKNLASSFDDLKIFFGADPGIAWRTLGVLLWCISPFGMMIVPFIVFGLGGCAAFLVAATGMVRRALWAFPLSYALLGALIL